MQLPHDLHRGVLVHAARTLEETLHLRERIQRSPRARSDHRVPPGLFKCLSGAVTWQRGGGCGYDRKGGVGRGREAQQCHQHGRYPSLS
eukprot:CAMPEP_0184396158 /NCGR_PEP_ID=MMETSP0007-20130409/46794_1 /TAXON_ID=97485 /ORGANISM="Prymnesium parvum, Strain Texoma1" /LENGTH=88 /DNA_ID=CAMNT_0026748721 /DNA_START=580 /DNA_END=842 /DNA_ORIENTATION=-